VSKTREKIAIICGPLLVLAVVSFLKSAAIIKTAGRDFGISLAWLLAGDLVSLSFLLLLLVFSALSHTKFLRFLFLSLALLVFLFTLLDCGLVIFLGERLQFGDLWRFGSQWREASPLVGAYQVGILACSLFSVLLKVYSRRKTLIITALSTAVLLVLSFVLSRRADSLFIKYSVSSLEGVFRYSAISHRARYDKKQAELSRQRFSRPELKLPLGTPNIILLIIESLSSVDSEKVSGLGRRLPHFDDVSREGLLFVNFFSNYISSEGGMVSLLGGYPPLHFPGCSGELHYEFGFQDSVVQLFNKLGYHTEFMATNPLNFLNLEGFLRGVGVSFARYAGRDSLKEFRDADKFTFDAPADEVLYKQVLGRLQELAVSEKPYFFVISTTSSHTPWIDPLGREGAAQPLVWSYVDRAFFEFFKELKASGFFDTGILLVTGDHRRMDAVSEVELTKYGMSAQARVPLLILGKGVPAGKVDRRLFQQADLFKKLQTAVETEDPLSKDVLWVERYTVMWGELSNAGHVVVYSEEDLGQSAASAFVSGTNIEWTSKPPLRAAELEQEIHTQRATHQVVREERIKGCEIPLDEFLAPAPATGVAVQYFAGKDPSRSVLALAPVLSRERGVSMISPEYFPNQDDLPRGAKLRRLVAPFVVSVSGTYWLRLEASGAVCLFLDDVPVINLASDRSFGGLDGSVRLEAGVHRLELRNIPRRGSESLALWWMKPGQKTVEREMVPEEVYVGQK
jgi:hypothetical protein